MTTFRNKPRVALVYDRVNTKYGGAEHVLCALHQLYPEAPLFTSVYDDKAAEWSCEMTVYPSFLQHFPAARRYHRQYVGLMPLAFESHQLDDYDIVISVTSAEAKGVLTKPHQLHIAYLLTPTRYLWSHPEEYMQPFPLNLLQKPIFSYLKWWDKAAAFRPDVYIPISQLVADRCKKYYQRQADHVLYPPVDFAINQNSPVDSTKEFNEPYYLIVARLVKYKKVDLAIHACGQLGKPLIIIGDGPEFSRLKRLADSYGSQAKITLIRSVQSNELAAYYKNCRAFLAPGEEDFGIATLEAHLFGKPAIIYYTSGAAEISPDEISSTHLFVQTVEGVKNAIVTTEQYKWQKSVIQKQVTQYSTANFQKQFADRVHLHWQQFQQQNA
jgi:glycosyltransferase involved in cell wall biosynthesis